MKNICIIFMCCCFSFESFSQKNDSSFKIEVQDTVGMNEELEVTFVLENGQGENFKMPDFGNQVEVLSGPNLATSMNFQNGRIAQIIQYSFILKPKQVGVFIIKPASIDIEGTTVKTKERKVVIVQQHTSEKKEETGSIFDIFFGKKNPFPFRIPKPDEEESSEEPTRPKRKTQKI